MSKQSVVRSGGAAFGLLFAAVTFGGMQTAFAADPLCEPHQTVRTSPSYEVLLNFMIHLDLASEEENLAEIKKPAQWIQDHGAEFRAMTPDQQLRVRYTPKACDVTQRWNDSSQQKLSLIQFALKTCGGYGLTNTERMATLRETESRIKKTLQTLNLALTNCRKVGLIPTSTKSGNSDTTPQLKSKADTTSPITRADFQAQDPERQKTVLRQLVRKVWKADCKPMSIAAGSPRAGEINHWSLKCEGSSLAQDYVVQLPTALDKPARVLKCYAEPGATKCDTEGKPSKAAQDKRG